MKTTGLNIIEAYRMLKAGRCPHARLRGVCLDCYPRGFGGEQYPDQAKYERWREG